MLEQAAKLFTGTKAWLNNGCSDFQPITVAIPPFSRAWVTADIPSQEPLRHGISLTIPKPMC